MEAGGESLNPNHFVMNDDQEVMSPSGRRDLPHPGSWLDMDGEATEGQGSGVAPERPLRGSSGVTPDNPAGHVASLDPSGAQQQDDEDTATRLRRQEASTAASSGAGTSPGVPQPEPPSSTSTSTRPREQGGGVMEHGGGATSLPAPTAGDPVFQWAANMWSRLTDTGVTLGDQGPLSEGRWGVVTPFPSRTRRDNHWCSKARRRATLEQACRGRMALWSEHTRTRPWNVERLLFLLRRGRNQVRPWSVEQRHFGRQGRIRTRSWREVEQLHFMRSGRIRIRPWRGERRLPARTGRRSRALQHHDELRWAGAWGCSRQSSCRDWTTCLNKRPS